MGEQANDRMVAVQTGQPLTWLLACARCGVLLWDADAHYAHAHPEEADDDR